MKIVVDANIVFSGILNTDGKIGDLLINSKGHFNFIAPEYLQIEIRKHYKKLANISRHSIHQVQESEFQVCKDITFISQGQIKSSTWEISYKLVKDVDLKDIHYIALSKHFKCKIWSGNKALIAGLVKKNFNKFISTNELYKLRER